MEVSLGAAALGMFFYHLGLVCKMAVIHREKTSIQVELPQTQNSSRLRIIAEEWAPLSRNMSFEDQQQADILRREITSMTQIMGFHAAFALELIILFTADDRITRPFAVAIVVFAALAFLCFIGAIRSLSKASFLTTIPFAPLDIQAQKKYMEVLMVLGFVLAEVGYRLFYFTLALVTGWLLGPIPMLLATGVLVLYLLITDSYPPIPVPAPLPREDPVPVPHHQIIMPAALPREDPVPVRHHQIRMQLPFQQYLLARNIYGRVL